jgi:Fic family protein
MRTFEYGRIAKDLMTNDVFNLVAAIHEYKGQQKLFIGSKADVLTSLLEVAKIQSTESSNRIEGIRTSDKRIAELVKLKAAPRNRNENEIAGYRDVLAMIHESYDFITISPNIILQLHRDLYAYSPSSLGGQFKNSDNQIEEIDAEGNAVIRFRPVPAFETPLAMENLCEAYSKEIEQGEIDPLILIPAFILDFLCIHPFNDGNGRMSRLLTLLLLYRSGYIVGKYISVEMLIEKTKYTYYDALKACSADWHEGTNDYLPFVRYYLGVVLNAYKEFASRIEYLSIKSLSKPQRIESVLKNHLGSMTMSELQSRCPDISYSTMSKTLNALQANGKIKRISAGRYSEYVWSHDVN